MLQARAEIMFQPCVFLVSGPSPLRGLLRATNYTVLRDMGGIWRAMAGHGRQCHGRPAMAGQGWPKPPMAGHGRP